VWRWRSERASTCPGFSLRAKRRARLLREYAKTRGVNPYNPITSLISPRWSQRSKSLPLGGFAPLPRPQLSPDAPVALFFAPHPDDETISGGMALRLMREAKMRVVNVAVTQGRIPERHGPRLKELQSACEYLGFGLITTGPPRSRQNQSGNPAK